MSLIHMPSGRRRARQTAAQVPETDNTLWHMYQRSLAERPAQRRVVVSVDGSPGSAAAFLQAVSQARQRNATLDVVYVIPDDADAAAVVTARVMLGAFTRRECPYGVGAPVCLRVERGDPEAALLRASAGAELLITGP